MSDDERAFDALLAPLPRVAPPADLWDRIAEEIQPSAKVLPFRRRVPRSARLGAAVAALTAVAAAVLLVALTRTGSSGSVTATAQVVSHLSSADVHGTASLYGAPNSNGMVGLSLASVPSPPSGHHYEVWVLARGETQMTAVGSFTPASRNVRLKLPLPAPGDYAAVDISVQENGGPAAHSSVSLAGGAFH